MEGIGTEWNGSQPDDRDYFLFAFNVGSALQLQILGESWIRRITAPMYQLFPSIQMEKIEIAPPSIVMRMQQDTREMGIQSHKHRSTAKGI